MAFISSYTYSLDAKKRILIPSKFRDELGDNFYITRSLDDCLTIYPEKVWEEFIERINNLPDTDSAIAREYFMAYALKCTPDSSGRILLEDKHMRHAKISKNAVFQSILMIITVIMLKRIINSQWIYFLFTASFPVRRCPSGRQRSTAWCVLP